MQYLYLAESEIKWGTYSTEIRLEKIAAHLKNQQQQIGAVVIMVIIILFIESFTLLFIDEILKIFAK